jgi:hypothetical protein
MMESTQAQTVSPGPSITRLFGSFLRLGITAFGGPAMIAFMRKMAVTQRHWIDPCLLERSLALKSDTAITDFHSDPVRSAIEH